MSSQLQYIDLTAYLAAQGYYKREYADRVNEARQARGENPLGCPRWDRCGKRFVARERRRGRKIRALGREYGITWCQRCVPTNERLPLRKAAKDP